MLVEDTWTDAIVEAGTSLWKLDLGGESFQPLLEPTPDPKHGDATSGVCFKLARVLRKSPREIAQSLAEHLERQKLPYLESVELAGAGYVNFRATSDFYLDAVLRARTEQQTYGRSAMGKGKRILIEHTSANPTGPLHIAHGRQAAIGDTIANLLEFTGHEVAREYYLNDTGGQIEMLGRSLHARYLQSFDPDHPFPEKGYQGDYVKDIARSIRDKDGDRWKNAEAIEHFSAEGRDALLTRIRSDLAQFRVKFDSWYSEEELRKSGRVEALLDEFKKRGLTFMKDGALHLRATQLGDPQDWVLVKSNGDYTYRQPDFAYHLHKFERGFEGLVDLLGPDHSAYADSMKRVMIGLGHPNLRVVLVQHCRLLRGGEEVKMSKRAASYVTLRELIEEVGVDAARYFFLMRRTSSHFDFDLEIAKKKTLENPVYYIQNAHARICSVWNKGVEKKLIPAEEVADGFWGGSIEGAKLGPHEIAVLRAVIRYRRAVEMAARDLEPSRLCTYLYEAAGEFHSYYQKKENVILCEDRALRLGRMGMAAAVQIVLHSGLSLLGVHAPTYMEKLEEA